MNDIESSTTAKWVSLVNLLDRLTRNSLLSWDESSEPESFITNVGSEVIKISRTGSQNHPGEDSIRITLSDDFGTVIDSFLDEDLPSDANFSPYIVMNELHKIIARKARGADEALARVIKTLSEKDDDFPF